MSARTRLAFCFAAALSVGSLTAGLTASSAAPRESVAARTPAPAGQSGEPKTIVVNENTHGRTVATDANGPLQLLFADGTAMTLGSNSELTIDSFEFDPAGQSAKLVATLTRGDFRFIGGQASKSMDGVALATLYGTLALEAAGADLSLGTDDTPAHFDMVYGGTMTLASGSAVLARVRKAGYSIVPSPKGGRASIRITPSKWRSGLLERLSRMPEGEPFTPPKGATKPRAEPK